MRILALFGSLRIVLVVFTAITALYMGLVALGNISDYGTNQAFVQHVLAMDTTLSSSNTKWRAVNRPPTGHRRLHNHHQLGVSHRAGPRNRIFRMAAGNCPEADICDCLPAVDLRLAHAGPPVWRWVHHRRLRMVRNVAVHKMERDTDRVPAGRYATREWR